MQLTESIVIMDKELALEEADRALAIRLASLFQIIITLFLVHHRWVRPSRHKTPHIIVETSRK